jgi:DNA invertase Pin-like site-specific DNA recombinase
LTKLARYHLFWVVTEPIMTTKAFAYLRTSSVTNAGEQKDSGTRQRRAIAAYAKAQGLEIAGEYYDIDTKGSEPVYLRSAFSQMLAVIASNGVRTIIVESASRFARDLLVQEVGFEHLRDLGITLIAADDPDAFTAETPTATLIRQILGAVSEFEKASLVAKLKGARDRVRAREGRCEGPKPVPEEVRRLARRLARQGDLSLRQIAAKLAARGMNGPSGKPYGAQSIKLMLSLR